MNSKYVYTAMILAADILFVIGWWPKEYLGQHEFKWLQLLSPIMLNAMLIGRLRTRREES